MNSFQLLHFRNHVCHLGLTDLKVTKEKCDEGIDWMAKLLKQIECQDMIKKLNEVVFFKFIFLLFKDFHKDSYIAQ